MNKIWIPIMFICFFGLIGFAIYYTNKLTPLWALLLLPVVEIRNKSKKSKNKE